MTSRRFNRKPEPSNKSNSYKKNMTKLGEFLKDSSDQDFIRDLIITNAVLERLLIKQVKRNIKLELESEQRNAPFFYFNNN